MTLNILSKPGCCLLTALLVICLSGCKEDFALLDDSGKIVGKGRVGNNSEFPVTGASDARREGIYRALE